MSGNVVYLTCPECGVPLVPFGGEDVHGAWVCGRDAGFSGEVMRAKEDGMAKQKVDLTRAQRWTLVQLLSAPYCLRSDMRSRLLARRLVRLHPRRCSEHEGQRFVEITEKGRRALGIRG